MISKNKIEDRALSALQNIINNHNTMGNKFNSMDKEMSWDGYITIFIKNNGDQSKENFDDKIPVQIKGHIDSNNKYLSKKQINYSVKLSDLEVYFRDRGVMYFLIFMSPSGEQEEIFYSNLLPSKIKYYLDCARQRGNKKFISISFLKMERNPNALYSILKQFSNESRQQGCGLGPIIERTIDFDNIGQVSNLHCSAIGITSYPDLISKLKFGEVNLYGKQSINDIPLPIEYNENTQYLIEETYKNSVKIKNKIFYKEFKVKFISDNQVWIIFSENLSLDMRKKQFIFSPVSNLKQIKTDVEFIKSLYKNKSFTIFGTKIYQNANPSEKQSIIELEKFLELYEILNDLKIIINEPFSKLNSKTIESLNFVYELKKTTDKLNQSTSDSIVYNEIFVLTIEDKLLPIIFYGKSPDIKVENFLYSNKIKLSISSDNNHYNVPNFAYLSSYQLCNLYYYDHNAFKKQIEQENVNENTIVFLKDSIMKLINIYDKTNDIFFLNLARKQLNKISAFLDDKQQKLINFQIKSRKRDLTKTEQAFLCDLAIDNSMIGFMKYVLLKDLDNARSYYEKLTNEEQNFLVSQPIMYNFELLKKKSN